MRLGIKSHLGRDCENITCPTGKYRDQTKMKAFKAGLLGYRKKHAREQAGREEPLWEKPDEFGVDSGLSIFDPALCEVLYTWFCPPGGTILDPFAGGSVRGVVANMLGFQYVGVDLRPEQNRANEEQAEMLCNKPHPRWFDGDASDPGTYARLDNKVDFFFSCPPYGDLEVYSDNPADLSAMTHDDFIAAYRKAIKLGVDLLNNDRFACFVVGDYRDPKGYYRKFPSITIDAFEAAGAKYYNEAIFITVAGSLPIRARKQFNAGRKLGKSHQNILVFLKGDGKKAAAAITAGLSPELKEIIQTEPDDEPDYSPMEDDGQLPMFEKEA